MVTVIMLSVLDIGRLHSPILHKLNIIKLVILIIDPYNVPFMASFEYPIPFKLLVSGACI